MNILLTNDDGIYAEGIYAVYQKLAQIGSVTVVAPSSERSSTGQAITLSHPIRSYKINRKDQFFGHAVSGTPSDCVKFALDVVLDQKPDLIVSGINIGANDGCSIFYSGTVAGAREGAMNAIPSFAISLNAFQNADFSYAATFAAQLAKKILTSTLPKGTFLNVNVPNVAASDIQGIKVTQQGLIPIHGVYKENEDPSLQKYFWLTGNLPPHDNNADTDTCALENNFITIVPSQVDTTNHHFLSDLKKWNFDEC